MADPLVIVSNRGPVAFRRENGELRTVRGAGGLVTALRSLVDRHDVAWVATALGEGDREVAAGGPRSERLGDGGAFRLHLVALAPEIYAPFYRVIANPVLWFVQHGLWELKHDPDADLAAAWADGYVAANRALAAAAVDELDAVPGAPLLLQDYHLYLVPSLVREARPETRIAHFVHIPWVGPDGWAVLPEPIVRAVHEGLLAADSIGFHTERWRAAFVETCDAVLGRGADAEARSHANPIAIDAADLERLAASPAVQERRRELLAQRPETLVLRVDRTDPSKNAVRGFAAFGRLLELEPELDGRVQLLALLDPSRQEIPEYVEYRQATEAAAAAVNDRFGRPGWQPVRLDVRDDFPASVAAFLEYDVLLVNPVKDGLNLVAKEAPLVNGRSGAVVLSREAGAYEELHDWVLGVDPLDVEEQAEALRAAIRLPPAERESRRVEIRDHVRTHDLDAWAGRELEELARRTPGSRGQAG
jgi:trehalose 6-phosphate synthase